MPVIFDYAAWALLFPELAQYVNSGQAAGYFAVAETLCDNTPCSPVPNCAPAYLRATLLNWLTAHVAALMAPLGAPSSPLVGRINSAGQGSVNVGTDMAPMPSRDYFAQTKYGLAYWQMTAQFRSFRYAPGYVRRQTPVTLWPGGNGGG